MPALIANPVINGPYEAPTRHFRFDADGITDEIVEGRRRSEYFIPVPGTRKHAGQLHLDPQWNLDRLQPNDFVNQIRASMDRWRRRNYPHVTATSRRRIEYWNDPARENPVLFCQREAAETAIFLTEAANRDGQPWIGVQLAETNEDYNLGLSRIALKMATGAGKTVVMAMLVAWQTLNKAANAQDRRFTRRFLVVCPGVTIQDRLRVLLPDHPDNYYRQRDLVPPELVSRLSEAQIVIANRYVFLPKVTPAGKKLAKSTKDLVLGHRTDGIDPFLESPEQVAARLSREFGLRAGEIIVLNDEGHHCYREKPTERVEDDEMDADEREEVAQRADVARVWFRGLQALNERLGIKSVYDVSATPFFLKGSGYGEGTLFPWVVSDFSLIDAVESGIVKVPKLPVDDNAASPNVVFRSLWSEIATDLPKRAARVARARAEDPRLPPKLETALRTLYDHYAKEFEDWEAHGNSRGETPPVLIVVCNNTAVSKLVFDWIAGYEREIKAPDGTIQRGLVSGALEHFSNVEDGQRLTHPRTILVDSVALDSGEQLSREYRTLVTAEIEEFKADRIRRSPNSGDDDISDADLLREVLNTVGKSGKLGAAIRCVVSVGMLTEGWDANTVTHILGVRAFHTPLLTEQVVGRGLRRRSYDVGDDGHFPPEFATVFGVPFSFIPTSGATKDAKPRRAPVRVRALPERVAARISFPCLTGYRLEMPDPSLAADYSAPAAQMVLSTDISPTRVEITDIAGNTEVLEPEELRSMRAQEVAFRLTKRLIEREYQDDFGNVKPWFFPKVLKIVKAWMSHSVTFESGTYPGFLLLGDVLERCVEKLRYAIVAEDEREERLLAILDAEPEGSTDQVDFDTSRPAQPTESERSHVSHIVVDSGWELSVAHALEELDGVAAYVRNDHLGFTIPYTYEGNSARYYPDFLVRLDVAGTVTRTLIVEVSGGLKAHHAPGTVAEKAAAASHLWVPTVNRDGRWGRWGYLEIKDPKAADALLAPAISTLAADDRLPATVGGT